MVLLGGGGGFPTGERSQQGLTTSQGGGLNFNHDFSRNSRLNANYFANRIVNELESTTLRENLLDSSSFRTETQTQTRSRNLNQRLESRWRHEIDSTQNFTLDLRLSANDGSSRDSSLQRTFDDAGNPQNAGERRFTADGRTRGLESRLSYRKRFLKRGRALVADLSFQTDEDRRNGTLRSLNSFFPDARTDSLHQRQTYDNRRSNYRLALSYTEPLGKGWFGEFNLGRSRQQDRLQKDFFDLPLDGAAPPVFREDLSNRYRRTYTYDRGGFHLRLDRKRLHFNAGLALQNARLEGHLVAENQLLRKEFTHPLPAFSGSYEFAPGRNLNLSYRTEVQAPDLEQLQPLVDNSDPLNIYVGNPELRAAYHHRLGAHFLFFDQFSFTNLFLSLNANFTRNPIVHERSIDADFRQTTRPVNGPRAFQGNA
ncbi:MAG: hypothetical protein D6765_10370, partial [Bacteroidetes bacterium]